MRTAALIIAVFVIGAVAGASASYFIVSRDDDDASASARAEVALYFAELDAARSSRCKNGFGAFCTEFVVESIARLSDRRWKVQVRPTFGDPEQCFVVDLDNPPVIHPDPPAPIIANLPELTCDYSATQ